LHLVAPAPLATSGKLSQSRSPLFSTMPSVQRHITPPLYPCVGPGASPEHGVAPQPEELTPSPMLSSGAVDHIGELRISVACPPHCELVLLTMSGRCAVVHGRCPCSPSHQPSSRWPPPTAPRCTLCALSSHQSCHGTRTASCVGVGLGNPRAPCQTTSSQVMPCSAGSLRGTRYRHLATGEPTWTTPSRALYAIPGNARGRGLRPASRPHWPWAALFWLVRRCGQTTTSPTRIVHVGHAQILAQWPV
jgi:hypothetical protein